MAEEKCGEQHPDDRTRLCELPRNGHGDHLDFAHPNDPWLDLEVQRRVALKRTNGSGRSKKGRRSSMNQLAAAIASNQMSSTVGRAEGMSLAYDAQIPARQNFERVIYHLARTTPPDQEFSANEVWFHWREVLGWPDPEKKQFVGPAMKASATKHGWTRIVGETANTSGNGHAEREVNRTYSSLIYSL